TSIIMVEAGVYPETPNPDGSCNDGWASTPMGRALQMYTISASPEEHNQATNNYLPCLAAEALKGITGMQAASDCNNAGY
ncbi:MAG: hypothetical protein WAM42_03660, partial [Candidatus Nitrosopolaris sp.]